MQDRRLTKILEGKLIVGLDHELSMVTKGLDELCRSLSGLIMASPFVAHHRCLDRLCLSIFYHKDRYSLGFLFSPSESIVNSHFWNHSLFVYSLLVGLIVSPTRNAFRAPASEWKVRGLRGSPFCLCWS